MTLPTPPLWAPLLLLLSCAAQAQPVDRPLPPLVAVESGSIHPAWRVVGFPRRHADIPPTLFQADAIDGQSALRVDTNASYGTLVNDWKGPAQPLRWRWRLDQPLTGGTAPPDLMAKSGDDAALKVCVMFDHALDRVPFMERTVLRIARGVSGENLPAATVCYVWDSGRPATLQGTNPYTNRVRFFSLQGKGAPLGQWVAQSRNVAQDFVTLFADELPQGKATALTDVPMVTSVVIGADSDNTASRSTAWIADLQWATPAP
ncbi:DUF3047 domain-containing protein [Hydrogenophaga sp.]|uniref:DUF3047 domain-containing protein n=1 Tax=Hydrogenophaga sp. TaxID=1904254 RepID=UPI002728E1EF|nr:DUF3047 domain-containing protein [Hydrogenophaga sp.]MDO8905358.1 DUF3047 domain-containing protein [Hydrogenophaga sp.]